MATHSSAIALAETPHRIDEVNPTAKIEALAEIICGAGEEAAAPLQPGNPAAHITAAGS